MWIDTHCHLDAHEFGADSLAVAGAPPAGRVDDRDSGGRTRQFRRPSPARACAPNASYALGIHPIYVPQARDEDLALLRTAVEAAMGDPHFVAIGEIGLDFFIPMLCEPAMRDKQERFFREQLRIARDFGLPVLTHVRRSQDQVLKHLRQITPPGGIAHAFNGSEQQAHLHQARHASRVRRRHDVYAGAADPAPGRRPAARPHRARDRCAGHFASWIHPGRNSPEQLPAIGAALASCAASTRMDPRGGLAQFDGRDSAPGGCCPSGIKPAEIGGIGLAFAEPFALADSAVQAYSECPDRPKFATVPAHNDGATVYCRVRATMALSPGRRIGQRE
jgi:TatD DNase family protein